MDRLPPNAFVVERRPGISGELSNDQYSKRLRIGDVKIRFAREHERKEQNTFAGSGTVRDVMSIDESR